jgi:hypothetical protein
MLPAHFGDLSFWGDTATSDVVPTTSGDLWGSFYTPQATRVRILRVRLGVLGLLLGRKIRSVAPRFIYTSSTPTHANGGERTRDAPGANTGVSEQRRPTTTLTLRIHTAEVAGSKPASPTSAMLRSAGKNAVQNARSRVDLGPLCSNVDGVTLSGSSAFRISTRRRSSFTS